MLTIWKPLLLLLIVIAVPGCAEGPLWKVSQYAPWVQDQWAAEEQIADTSFSKKREMSEMTAAAIRAPLDEQQRVAEQLSEVVKRNRITLLRLHAIRMLSRLNCPASLETLALASSDDNSEVRLEAIRAWRQMPPDKAIPHLQEMLGSDTDIDVRLAATRALSGFSGPQAVAAIGLALNDPDPALQRRAVYALREVTGESYDGDVAAWRDYVRQYQPDVSELSNRSAPRPGDFDPPGNPVVGSGAGTPF